jgi:hypothetical protein
MRRQDILPGKVYAYREGSYGSYRKVVFLTEATSETLYTTNRWKRGVGFLRDRYRKSPAKNNGYTAASGWLAAKGENLGQASLQEALMNGVQVKDNNTEIPYSEREYEYFLVTSMAYIHGDYEVITAEERNAEALRIERSNLQKAKHLEIQRAWLPIRARFRDLFGGEVNLAKGTNLWDQNNWNKDGENSPDRIVLDREAAESVVSYVSELKELVDSLRSENEGLAWENSDLNNRVESLEYDNIELRNRVHFLEP